MVDAWALSRAAGGATALSEKGGNEGESTPSTTASGRTRPRVSWEDGTTAGSEAGTGSLEARYPVQAVQVREAADPQHAPLRDLHPKDVLPPSPYKGDCASWLEWSAKFRRYALSRSNRSLTHLLEKVELLRGNPVKPSDEQIWEADLHLSLGIME